MAPDAPIDRWFRPCEHMWIVHQEIVVERARDGVLPSSQMQQRAWALGEDVEQLQDFPLLGVQLSMVIMLELGPALG
jgi:hypothetical protein